MQKPEHKLSVSSNADQDDLFSAHDFDIHIDLPTNSNGKLLMYILHGKRNNFQDF